MADKPPDATEANWDGKADAANLSDEANDLADKPAKADELMSQ